MQQAIPCRTHLPKTLKNPNQVRTIGSTRFPIDNGRNDDLEKMVKENAVVIFARSGCCMSHVVKRLLQSLGANAAVYEVEERSEGDVVGELRAADARGEGMEGTVQLPVVFIGGRWFGGLDRVIATHITGELTPLLRQAGALWL